MKLTQTTQNLHCQGEPNACVPNAKLYSTASRNHLRWASRWFRPPMHRFRVNYTSMLISKTLVDPTRSPPDPTQAPMDPTQPPNASQWNISFRNSNSSHWMYTLSCLFNSIFVLIANANADSSDMWALVGSEKVFRYQHVGIGNLKSARWGSEPTRDPQSEWFHVEVEYRL